MLILRMAHSFLSQVGRPRRFCVVSDGTVSARTARAVTALDGCVEVIDWRELIDSPLPPAIERYAGMFPLGKKLAMLVSLRGWPALVLDSDIEFFSGGHRLRSLLEGDDPSHWYQHNGTDAYDARLTDGLEMLGAVCSGVMLLRSELDWTTGIERLERYAESGGDWTEQTVAAIALTQAGARVLPRDDYVVYWDDIKYPWDHHAGTDIVLRHYLAYMQRWKMWMRGGPSGYRTIPWAVLQETGRQTRSLSDWLTRSAAR
jgi:hypothetical protein